MEVIDDNYISLAEAAQRSPYSQEYLSLRARQGKLRAVKQGRNWFTTSQWLDDYLSHVNQVQQELSQATVAIVPPAQSETEFIHHPAAKGGVTQTRESEDKLKLDENWLASPTPAKAWYEEPVQSVPIKRITHPPIQSASPPAHPTIEKKVLIQAGFSPTLLSTAREELFSPSTTKSDPQFWSASPTKPSFLATTLQPVLAIVTVVGLVFAFLALDQPLQLATNIAAGAENLTTNIHAGALALGGQTTAKSRLAADIPSGNVVTRWDLDQPTSQARPIDQETSGTVAGVSTAEAPPAGGLSIFERVGTGIAAGIVTVIESLTEADESLARRFSDWLIEEYDL